MVHAKTLFSMYLFKEYKGPVTAPTSKSATDRFMMRYVLRLRRWRILAKAMIVMALIINITTDSVIRTGNQTGESTAVILLTWDKRSLRDGVFVFVPAQLW